MRECRPRSALRTSRASREARPLKLPDLSASQRQALINLSKKQSGEEVEFINIADARALTELGLASRTQQGWVITSLGASLLQGEDGAAPAPGGSSITRLTPRPS